MLVSFHARDEETLRSFYDKVWETLRRFYNSDQETLLNFERLIAQEIGFFYFITWKLQITGGCQLF